MYREGAKRACVLEAEKDTAEETSSWPREESIIRQLLLAWIYDGGDAYPLGGADLRLRRRTLSRWGQSSLHH